MLEGLSGGQMESGLEREKGGILTQWLRPGRARLVERRGQSEDILGVPKCSL